MSAFLPRWKVVVEMPSFENRPERSKCRLTTPIDPVRVIGEANTVRAPMAT